MSTTPTSGNEFPQARVWVEAYDVDLRFRQLGVSRPPFVEAAQKGDLHRRLWNTADDFGAAGGFNAWAGSLKGLRQALRGFHEFHTGDFLRIPVSFSEDEWIAFAISWSDDDRVGKDGPDPTTNVKGPATVTAVEEGGQEGQGVLDLDHPVDLWYLLIHVTDDGELWAEVSWAANTDESDRIAGWYERIILGRVDPGDDARVGIPEGNDGPSDIDIDISRKSA